MQIYPCGDRQLYHLDLYRIEGSEDLDSTGYRDAISGDDILVVEWPERVPEVIIGHHLAVKLEYSGDSRQVNISGVGEKYEQLLVQIESEIKESVG
jgi:tRNA threonylcarbamoyladenosine biosynthesis protein TsaE